MLNEKVISFPNIGDYHVPITYFLTHITKYKVMPPLPNTKRTIELGCKYSPDYVCMPFKYNLGNFIESLERGANILIQAGGGCRYGYYSEIQDRILKDLGYDFKMYNLMNASKFSFKHIYKTAKEIDKKIRLHKLIYYGLITVLMVIFMDLIDEDIRKNIGFEIEKGSFKKVKENMLKDFSNTKGFIDLTRNFIKYKRKIKNIPVDKDENRIKIGIIGELYTAMDPFSTYYLEEELANMNIEIKRFTNATYLLLLKKFLRKRNLRHIKNYCKYPIGADGMDNIYRVKWLSDNNFDGIIHTKPSFCTPEIGAIPIIDKIAKDNDLPIIYFSFDEKYASEAMKTRLEAFYDLIKNKKEGK